MSLLLMERFATNPDWTRISARRFTRAQELVTLIQSRCYLSRDQQHEDYYGWIVELKGMLDD